MNLELFMTILVMSATATSLGVQLIKTILDKAHVTYKSVPLTVAVAFLVGIGEMIAYCLTHSMSFGVPMALYALSMGIVNAVSASTGYDLVRKFIYALFGKTS